MKSVGEAMAIGRTFKEALQKAVRSLENGRDGLPSLIDGSTTRVREKLSQRGDDGACSAAAALDDEQPRRSGRAARALLSVIRRRSATGSSTSPTRCASDATARCPS